MSSAFSFTTSTITDPINDVVSELGTIAKNVDNLNSAVTQNVLKELPDLSGVPSTLTNLVNTIESIGAQVTSLVKNLPSLLSKEVTELDQELKSLNLEDYAKEALNELFSSIERPLIIGGSIIAGMLLVIIILLLINLFK
jgi:predicted PurR-regulated permease PerM